MIQAAAVPWCAAIPRLRCMLRHAPWPIPARVAKARPTADPCGHCFSTPQTRPNLDIYGAPALQPRSSHEPIFIGLLLNIAANMSRRLRRVTAELDSGVHELASDTCMAVREQVTAGRGGSTSQLHPQDLPTDIMHDQTGSDVAMDANEQDVDLVPNNRDRAPRRGRRVTINKDLRKKRAKGKQIEISFPPQFKKVCGKHARLFKSEISVIVRSIPLKVKKWKELDDLHPAATADAWRKLKGKFPELSDQDKECAMKQVESQYNNRRYRLLQVYKQNKPRPAVVSPEDWQWLIRNLWTDADFKKRSDQNSLNRAKQEMGSKVGTKSIIQIAYELRDPETGEWPTAMQVWRATYQKADGTWSIPSGEETMTRLQEAAETHQERISAAPVPLVEHFALVLGRKPNHSRGVGIHAVNRVAEERIRLQAEIEAAEQRAADAQARAEAADQRAEAAEQRAQVMEGQLATMVESNAQMQEEQQSQRVELNSIRDTQNGEVARLVKQQLDQHMALFFERMRSGAPISFSQPLADNQGRLNGDE
ncbi:hypothetical protein ACP70R_032095 [Stipagrostis hirtigluma subsp. patula]